jgi:hypothetical protein
MAIVALPASPGLAEIVWTQAQPTQVNKSEFTSRRRVTILPAAPRWTASVRVVPILGEAAVRPWRSFFAKLQGQAGQFRLIAVEGPQITGVAVQVDGASQAGTTIATKGWGAAGLKLREGCLFTLDDQLITLTADVVADGTGKAILTSAVPVRISPANNAPVEVSLPYGLMSMVDDARPITAGKGQQYTIEFACEESF